MATVNVSASGSPKRDEEAVSVIPASAGEAAKPLRDLIADSLRKQIITGGIKPGRRLREDEIAGDHGVSRVPVREAIQKLESEGYVTLTPFRGATVEEPSADRALQTMQIRRALEVMAARLAAENHGEPVARQLVLLVEQGNRAATARQFRKIPELVSRFHELIATASGNPELVEMLALYHDKVDWMFAVDLHERAEGEWQDHAGILDAVLTGDGDLAGTRMESHVIKDEEACRALAVQGRIGHRGRGRRR